MTSSNRWELSCETLQNRLIRAKIGRLGQARACESARARFSAAKRIRVTFSAAESVAWLICMLLLLLLPLLLLPLHLAQVPKTGSANPGGFFKVLLLPLLLPLLPTTSGLPKMHNLGMFDSHNQESLGCHLHSVACIPLVQQSIELFESQWLPRKWHRSSLIPCDSNLHMLFSVVLTLDETHEERTNVRVNERTKERREKWFSFEEREKRDVEEPFNFVRPRLVQAPISFGYQKNNGHAQSSFLKGEIFKFRIGFRIRNLLGSTNFENTKIRV